MSIMIDIPPAIAQEAQDYVALEGKSLEKMFLDFLTAELQRRRKAVTLISEFDTLVEKTSARRDKPYVFNRADAYEEVMG